MPPWTRPATSSSPWRSTCFAGRRRGGRVSPTFGEHRRTGYSEGPNFSPNYAILLHKWRTRLSLTINREIANAIFEGARKPLNF